VPCEAESAASQDQREASDLAGGIHLLAILARIMPGHFPKFFPSHSRDEPRHGFSRHVLQRRRSRFSSARPTPFPQASIIKALTSPRILNITKSIDLMIFSRA
jgi:hypothetical protein